jgi:pimeloyl-ACP methyl ester carboxylesterase
VLVHGYPDSHHVWLPLIALLSAQYYVIAYDVRGAGMSDVPPKIADYRLDILSQDLEAVVDAIIPGRSFHLIAHDWGSIQSWESVTTDRLKGRIASYTSMSGPSLDHAGLWMRRRLLNPSIDPKHNAFRQLMSSWYIVMFQLPLVPEQLWKRALGSRWTKYLAAREGVVEATPNPTQTADGQYGVRLYRANFISKMTMPQQRHAHCPVQLIVLNKDNYVKSFLFDDLTTWVSDLYRRDLNAGHWAVLSDPEPIAAWIKEWVAAVDAKQLSTLDALKVTAAA